MSSEKRVEIGKMLGVKEEHVIHMRKAYENKECLAGCMLFLQSNAKVDNQLMRELLISSFGLGIGEIRILHLWWEGLISNEELNDDLSKKIAAKNK